MHNECAHTVTPAILGGLCLNTIWHVDADDSYDITAAGQLPETLIALRTIRGQGRLTLHSGEIVDAGEETFCLFRHKNIRRYACRGNKWVFWWFQFSVDNSKDLPLNQLMKIPPSPTEESDLHGCFSLLKKNNPDASALASAYLQHLICSTVYTWNRSRLPPHSHRDMVERLIERMHEMPNDFTVEEMARAACLSVRRFRQVFVQTTGQSPKRFYDTMRLEMAGELLNKSTQGLAEIADRLGYSSLFHLSREFKRHFGTSPSKFRLR